MAVQLSSNHLIHNLDRPPTAPAISNPSSEPSLATLLLSEVTSQPLNWLWPGRIPLGHLTLLEAAPSSGLSLVALTLAACVSSGSSLPDGTPTQQGHVILFAPYDCASDTLKPRLEAAGGNPAHVTLLRPPVAAASPRPKRTRSASPRFDLDHLASTIHQVDARLVILDPASAIPALSRHLPALIDLAQQTGCAILLTRSLRRAPVNPLRWSGPTSLLREAVRSCLLLTPHPADEHQHLLLCPHHPLCPQPSILAYDILFSPEVIPTIHWLPQPLRSQLERLCTGPLHSPHRQAILRFLQQSSTAHPIPDILNATCYDYEAGRKMLQRMKLAGELVSPTAGLYTTAAHHSLLPSDHPSVSDVPSLSNITFSSVPDVPSVSDFTLSSITDVPDVPSVSDFTLPLVSDLSDFTLTRLSDLPRVPTSPSSPTPNIPYSKRGRSKTGQKRRSTHKRQQKRH